MAKNTRPDAAVRLRQLFDDESLLDPRGGDGNTVDLIRAVACHCGVPDLDLSPESQSLNSVIGDAKHLVFVLIDGLGMNLLHRLDPAGFFHSCECRELRALAPSTTACVLTALATGAYPSDHAITGWFTRLPECGRTTIPLPYVDRASNESLIYHGIRPEDLFPIPSILPRMTADVLCFFPEMYADSYYTRYWRGGVPADGYASLLDAVERIAQHSRRNERPSFTYLYIPLVDDVSHQFGPASEEALAAAHEVEKALEILAEKLGGRARLLCTADHGQIHVPNESRFLLFDGDPLLDLLQAPPSGEDRFPLFHIRSGAGDEFCALFEERYGEHFLLLSIGDANALRLFGPGRMTPVARQRFGDFAAIATEPWVLGYSPSEKDASFHHLGRHGGLSPDEMRVPLLCR